MKESPTLPVVDSAASIVADYGIGAIRKWKAETGGMAIGYMPVYVPRELFHALGVLPAGIVGAGDLEIIRGDAYYQSYICHIPRSTIELGLNGSLDCLDGMIFPATCDVIRNLSGMWTLLFPKAFVHYLDVPQNFDPELGGAFYRSELEHIASQLTARGARELSAETLARSIECFNEHRREVEALYELRRTEPWKVPASELYLVLRAGLTLSVEEHLAMLRRYRDEVDADVARTPMDQARVVLTGSFCEQPPIGLIKTLERAGCYIVDDDFMQVFRWISGDIAVGKDPLGDLVTAFLKQSIASPIRYIADDEKGRALVQRVSESEAEGILFCAPSFCDPALLDQPMVARAVARAGIPTTSFKYAENSGQFQVIREQAGTFADSIKLWSGR